MDKHPYLEKILALSTAHMPNTDPDFGGLRTAAFEYGVVVWVSEPWGQTLPNALTGAVGDGVPEWIMPAMTLAYEAKCTLILFDCECNEDPDLPSWDW